MPKQNSSILFNRYIWLINLIYSEGAISRDDINRRWRDSSLNFDQEFEIPERTFHRYRDAIEELFQININYDVSKGYYIENAEDIRQDHLREWMLNTFAIKNLLSESMDMRDRILLEDIPSGQQFLSPIIEAMRNSIRLRVTYQSYTHATPSTFTIAPYCVKMFKQRWYVLAESEYIDKRLRIYSLDRILSVDRTKTSFKMPKDFDAGAYFAHTYGVSGCESKPEIIEIEVNAYQANYLRSLQLHPTQEEIEHNEDYSVFRYYVVPTFEFMQTIKSLGDAAEVRTPQRLRDELGYEYATLNNKYNSKQDD